MKRGKDKKRAGQVSVFIIIAIVAVVGIVGVYSFQSYEASQSDKYFSSSEIKPTVDSITMSIVGCRDSAVKNSLELIGVQGGFYNKPQNAFTVGKFFVPYYYYLGNVVSSPDATMISTEIGKSVDKDFENCVKEMSSSYTGFTIIQTTPKSTVKISKDFVDVTVDSQITITKENNNKVINLIKDTKSYKSALYDIIDVAKFITDSHKTDPRMMCISCIGDKANEAGLYVDFYDVSTDSSLVIVSENFTGSEPYSFEFMNKYSVDDLKYKSVATEIPTPGRTN